MSGRPVPSPAGGQRTPGCWKRFLSWSLFVAVCSAVFLDLSLSSARVPKHALGARLNDMRPTNAAKKRPRTRPPPSLPPHALASAPGALILNRNLPDPAVLDVRGRYYLYSSQTGFRTPPVSLTLSKDATLFHWDKTATALATVSSWAETGFTWAPDVRFIDGWPSKSLPSSSGSSLSCLSWPPN